MKMMALLCIVAISIGTVSCDSAYHKETDKMISQCEQSISRDNIDKCRADIKLIKTRDLTQKQSDKVQQVEKQINELDKEIEQERIASQKEREEKRRKEQEKREREEAERKRQIANEAYSEVMQLQDEVRFLIDKMVPCRNKMSYSVYGSYDYQNARIEYKQLMGTAIEKQKRSCTETKERKRCN